MTLSPTLSPKASAASAALGALVAGPTALLFTGSPWSAVVAAIGGAVTLWLVRRAMGGSLVLLAIATAFAVIVGGPVLMAIAAALSPGGTGNAGFVGLLFVFALAGQLVAFPLAVVSALLHAVVARATTA